MPKKELDLLPSERKAYESKIKELKGERDQVYGCVMRKINGIVIRADYLTKEQKEKLIAELLK